MIDKLRTIPKPALYEQLAEECTELAKASLKMSRILRGENPTPVKRKEAMEMIQEELSDVATVCFVLELDSDEDRIIQKMHRWAERLEAADETRQNDRDLSKAEGDT